MKKFAVVAWATLASLCFTSHGHAQGTNGPTNATLYLLINGGGSVTPLQDGQSLEVGQTYQMEAVPDSGFTFSSWEPMRVFVAISTFTNSFGGLVTNPPAIIYNLLPEYTNTPTLMFTMQPTVVLADTNGTTVTESQGWQVNFEPIPAPAILTISPLGNGSYQIVAPGTSDPQFPPLYCVLQFSTNFVLWTAISTNIFPLNGAGFGTNVFNDGYGVTNIVEATNSSTFFRVVTWSQVPSGP